VTVENNKLHLSLMGLQLMRLRPTLAKAKVTTRENISNGVVTIIVNCSNFLWTGFKILFQNYRVIKKKTNQECYLKSTEEKNVCQI
jgi:hypothetical protein